MKSIAVLKNIYDAIKARDAQKLRSIKEEQSTLRIKVKEYEPIHLFIYEKDDEAVDFLLDITDESSEVAELALRFYALQGNIDRTEKMRRRAVSGLWCAASYSWYKGFINTVIDNLEFGGHLNNSYSVLRLLVQLPDQKGNNGSLSIRQQYAMKLMRKLEVAKGEWSAMELLPIAKVLEDKMVKHRLTFDEAVFWYQHNAQLKSEEYLQKQSSNREKQQKIQIKNNFYKIIATLSLKQKRKKLKQKRKKLSKTETVIRSLLQEINKAKEVEVQEVDEVKRTKKEAKEAQSNVVERMQESKEFYHFKKAYFTEYYSRFFRNPFSKMKRKLNSLQPGEIISMKDIDQYAELHQKSRTTRVRDQMKK